MRIVNIRKSLGHGGKRPLIIYINNKYLIRVSLFESSKRGKNEDKVKDADSVFSDCFIYNPVTLFF